MGFQDCCPCLPRDTEPLTAVLGVLVPTPDTRPAVVLIAAEAVTLGPFHQPGGLGLSRGGTPCPLTALPLGRCGGTSAPSLVSHVSSGPSQGWAESGCPSLPSTWYLPLLRSQNSPCSCCASRSGFIMGSTSHRPFGTCTLCVIYHPCHLLHPLLHPPQPCHTELRTCTFLGSQCSFLFPGMAFLLLLAESYLSFKTQYHLLQEAFSDYSRPN